MGDYTCQDYRAEMILAGLQKRLEGKGISEEEKKAVKAEIRKIEKQMGID